MLDSRDHSRVRFKRVNENAGEEVEWKNIVKGYLKDEKYIVLEKEDLERANPKKNKLIELDSFVKEIEVADMIFKNAYYIEPQKEGAKAYNLLRDALAKSKTMGIGSFVLRAKEHLCMIGPVKDALVLHVVRFAEEVRDPAKLVLPKVDVSEKEGEMALSLIEQYQEKFDLTKYHDRYTEQLLKVIDEKASGKTSTAKVMTMKPKETKADDLLAKLQASLDAKAKAS